MNVHPGARVMALALAILPASLRAAGEMPTASPWDAYNDGVQAYETSRYAEALQHWQDLNLHPLPRGLRTPAWFQLGNAQFRLGEPLEPDAPEQAAEWWRRSIEAYRAVLERDRRHQPARHNLALAQRRLARLTHRLGLELFQKAEQQPLEAALDLLRPSVEHLNEAVALAPQDLAIRADRDRVAAALRRRLLERAGQAETRGDEQARQNNPWADPRAEEQYRAAIEDLGEVRRSAAEAKSDPAASPASDPSHPPAAAQDQAAHQAQERVSRKLSDLLTRMGRREQQTGNESARNDPDTALDHYEAALDHFSEAQRVQADNDAARRGEREVREALEQLHVQRGQQELEEGREMLGRRSPQAAQPLASALANFESAQSLNPDNQAARQGAEEARRLLPEALVLSGQRELSSGERAEAQRPADALTHYQQAENAFQQALDLKPDQAQARQGLQEVEPRLARLRDRLARQAEAEARQAAASRRPATLQDLLGQVNERDRDRPFDGDRKRQRGQKQTGTRQNPLDW